VEANHVWVFGSGKAFCPNDLNHVLAFDTGKLHDHDNLIFCVVLAPGVASCGGVAQ
jgi:hypothetical protein